MLPAFGEKRSLRASIETQVIPAQHEAQCVLGTRTFDIECKAIRASPGHRQLLRPQLDHRLRCRPTARVEIDLGLERADFDALQCYAASFGVEFQQHAAWRAPQRTLGTYLATTTRGQDAEVLGTDAEVEIASARRQRAIDSQLHSAGRQIDLAQAHCVAAQANAALSASDGTAHSSGEIAHVDVHHAALAKAVAARLDAKRQRAGQIRAHTRRVDVSRETRDSPAFAGFPFDFAVQASRAAQQLGLGLDDVQSARVQYGASLHVGRGQGAGQHPCRHVESIRLQTVERDRPPRTRHHGRARLQRPAEAVPATLQSELRTRIPQCHAAVEFSSHATAGCGEGHLPQRQHASRVQAVDADLERPRLEPRRQHLALCAVTLAIDVEFERPGEWPKEIRTAELPEFECLEARRPCQSPRRQDAKDCILDLGFEWFAERRIDEHFLEVAVDRSFRDPARAPDGL